MIYDLIDYYGYRNISGNIHKKNPTYTGCYKKSYKLAKS